MLKVLHIGSHFGNIGDNASHAVIRKAILRRVRAEFESLEIRRFYANARELAFDDAFAEHANRFDLVLIGGGNFLEPVHRHSSNGTTIDLGREVLSRLRVPVALNAVSFDPGKGEDEEILERFRAWAGMVAQNPQVHINLRDDGSLEDFTRLVGSPESFGFGLVPDPGLFYRPPGPFPFSERPYVAVNLAGDLAAIRYPTPGSREALFGALRDLMAGLPEEVALVLVPHVTMDVAIMGDFLRDSSDWASRKRILMAPLLQGYDDFWKPFEIYGKASGILANRFHSMICNLQYDLPLGVLANYPKMTKTLDRLGLGELRCCGEDGTRLLARFMGGDATRDRRPALVRRMEGEFEAAVDALLAFAHA